MVDLLELNIALKEINDVLSQEDVLRDEIEGLKQDIQQKKKETLLANTQVKIEKKEYDKLGKLSITSICASIKGNKREQQRKAKEKYEQIKSKYDHQISKLEMLEKTLQETQTLFTQMEEYKIKFKQLLQMKYEMLVDIAPETVDEIMRIESQKQQVTKRKLELEEAIDAGKVTYSSLYNAKNFLIRAAEWGTLDINGLGNSFYKYDNIQKANNLLSNCELHSKQFQNVLKGINEELDIQKVTISRGTQLLDVHFTTIIVDNKVQEKIKKSLSNVSDNLYKVKKIVKNIEKIKMKYIEQEDELERRSNQIILNYN